MRSTLFTPKRYQLKKDAALAVKRRHPWIFRRQISSAARIFPTGQWLRLQDHANQTLGYGIYDPLSVVGIRVLRTGPKAPTPSWIAERVYRSLTRRDPMREQTNALRLIHGENDGLPGIVLDQYGDVAVLQTYSRSVDALGRFAAACAREQLGLGGVLWREPAKRKDSARENRVLYGAVPDVVEVRENELHWRVPVRSGQKGGAYLDLRGLRRWIRSQSWQGKRVLNLFSNTGSLGLCSLMAGASRVLNVDDSEDTLRFGQTHHQQAGMEWQHADVFSWLKDHKGAYDVIIVDPPQLVATSKHGQAGLRAYERLHQQALRLLEPGGTVITCCCSSRLPRRDFLKASEKQLAPLRLQKALSTELDHPVAFPEGDYLKIAIFGPR